SPLPLLQFCSARKRRRRYTDRRGYLRRLCLYRSATKAEENRTADYGCECAKDQRLLCKAQFGTNLIDHNLLNSFSKAWSRNSGNQYLFRRYAALTHFQNSGRIRPRTAAVL